ncbi:hypothetical protein Tsubulata_022123, partial [Turnera subulata]
LLCFFPSSPDTTHPPISLLNYFPISLNNSLLCPSFPLTKPLPSSSPTSHPLPLFFNLLDNHSKPLPLLFTSPPSHALSSFSLSPPSSSSPTFAALSRR